MTTEKLTSEDVELIAAFIDRRMTQEERSAFMARLDHDESLYEIFIETARHRGQVAVERAPVAKRRIGPKLRLWVSGMAALLLIAVATGLLLRGTSGSSYAQMLIADGGLDRLPDDTWQTPPWSSSRGGELGGDAAAFRIGVRLVHLELALGKNDRQLAARLASLIERDLVRADSSAPARALYSMLRERAEHGETMDQLVTLAELSQELLLDSLPSPGLVGFGSWAEAGRLSAKSRNPDLLNSQTFRRDLRAATLRQEWEGDLQAELDELSDLLASPQELDFERLESKFSSLIRRAEWTED